MTRLAEKSRALESLLDLNLATLAQHEMRMQKELDQARQTIRDLKDVLRQKDEVLIAAKAAIDMFEDIYIPGLVACNKQFVERWEAETAVQAVRAGAVRTPSGVPE